MMMGAGFSDLRVKMVDGQLRTTDVTNLPLITAMLQVPREKFVPEAQRELAYLDDDILLTEKGSLEARYLMEPSPFGKLVQLLELGLSDKVLIVGSATGYSAAVLSKMAGTVVALESDPALAAKASAALENLACENVKLVQGSLPSGYKDAAPYDAILVEGSVEQLPQALLDQLGEGGRLVVVEGHGGAASARIYTMADGVATGRRVFNAAVKPLPGFEREQAFEF